MKTITITKSDLDSENKYKKEFIGKWNEREDVSVEIEGNLGWVVFEKGVYVNGSVVAEAGSGIKAGEGIEAGLGIEAGEGIEAGWGIKAGSGIKAGEGIEAGWGIKAGLGIEAGWGIKAGEGIKAGLGIEAGFGIVSLYSYIKAKLKIEIDARCKIVAGCFSFYGAQDVEAQEIVGDVIYGVKKLLPKEEVSKSVIGSEVEVKMNGKVYKEKITSEE